MLHLFELLFHLGFAECGLHMRANLFGHTGCQCPGDEKHKAEVEYCRLRDCETARSRDKTPTRNVSSSEIPKR